MHNAHKSLSKFIQSAGLSLTPISVREKFTDLTQSLISNMCVMSVLTKRNNKNRNRITLLELRSLKSLFNQSDTDRREEEKTARRV